MGEVLQIPNRARGRRNKPIGSGYSTTSSNLLYAGLIATTLLVMIFGELGSNFVPLATLFLVTVAASFMCDEENIFHMMIMGAHYAFWVFPVTVLTVFKLPLHTYPIALCVYALLLSLLLTNRTRFIGRAGQINTNFGMSTFTFIAIILALSLILELSSGKSFLYSIAFAIISAAIYCRHRGLGAKALAVLLVLAYTIIYSTNYWSGFGRLIIFSPLIVLFILIFKNYMSPILLKFSVFFGMSMGSMLGSMVRSNARTIPEAMQQSLKDSNVSPVMLLTDIYERSATHPINFTGWLDQLVLFFSIAVPREFWPSKPQGFGFQYTLDMLDSYLISAGHSIASTLAGEHIYYLGPIFAIVGLTIGILLISFLYNFLRSESIIGGFGSLAVAMWLPTFYWGGMASFSARFSLSAASLILIFVVYTCYANARRRWLRSQTIKTVRQPHA